MVLGLIEARIFVFSLVLVIGHDLHLITGEKGHEWTNKTQARTVVTL